MRRGTAPLRAILFRSRHRAPRPRGAGFTLLELLLVLVIVSIAAAVAVPRYGQSLAHYRAELGARRILADLERARQRARATGVSWQVVFDATGYTVQPVTVVDPADVTRVNLSRDPYLANVQKLNLGGDATVVFSGYGLPDSGGSLVVNSGVWAFQIDLDPQVGKARQRIYNGVFVAGGSGG